MKIAGDSVSDSRSIKDIGDFAIKHQLAGELFDVLLLKSDAL